jgi:hypothetical protein
VGVDRNPNSVLAQRYGTIPDRINHERDLPPSFADKAVYLRVKPKRIGTTPLGMTMKVIPSWISRSTLMEYDSIKSAKDCTQEVFQSLINTYFNKLMLYCDSVRFATGHLPINLPDIDVLSEAQRQLFYEIFFKKEYINGDTILVEKPMPDDGTASVEIESPSLLKKVKIVPQPVKNKILISLESFQEISKLDIDLYSSDAKLINRIWSGKIPKGEFEIEIPEINITSGIYFLQFISDDKQIAVYSFVKQ